MTSETSGIVKEAELLPDAPPDTSKETVATGPAARPEVNASSNSTGTKETAAGSQLKPVASRTIVGRQIAAKPAGSGASMTPKKFEPKKVEPKKIEPMQSLTERMADLLSLDAKTPPPTLRGGTTNSLHTGYFHFMLYGEPNTWKTTTAAEFRGPEHTLIIVTRRSEQLTPLARKGYKFVLAEDAEALRFALLHPEKAAEIAAQEAGEPEWAEKWKTDKERTIIVDDLTEGTNTLKEDYMYYVAEKGDDIGQTKRIKDPRQAYKKAGDELHDLLKITLGRQQHVGLIALDKSFDVEGTIDNRTEPDLPNKVMKLVETELEHVYYFPHGKDMQTKTSRVMRQAQIEGKKEMVSWVEITFAKCKLPLEYLGAGVVEAKEPKNLTVTWSKIQRAMRGDWPLPLRSPAAPQPLKK